MRTAALLHYQHTLASEKCPLLLGHRMSSLAGAHCYCGILEIQSPYYFLCEKCKRKFHEDCLKNGPASSLKGDYLFYFKCQSCGGGEEEFIRMRLQWLQVVQMTLYNLQLGGTGMCGYFRWKEHICAFIDKHWITFFGSHRKKTSLWHGTVAGVLSSGCPAVFLSGAQELKETGWWRLVESVPPSPHKIATPLAKPAAKKKETPPSPNDTPKEGLRSRRGKTSIQAAMELKAKRATLMEAKEIRKTKLAKSQNIEGSTVASTGAFSSVLSEHLQPASSPVITSDTRMGDPHCNFLKFTGLFTQVHQLPSQHAVSGSILVEHLASGTSSNDSLVSPHSGSVSLAECSDESSNISQSSYLTERDIKPAATVPNLLLCEDPMGADPYDSDDMEIDPGTLSPPPPGSPVRMHDSPTVEEILSAIDSYPQTYRQSSVDDMSNIDSSNQGSSLLDNSNQGSVSMDTNYPETSSDHGNFSIFRNYSEVQRQTNLATAMSCSQTSDIDDGSVVDSESESDSVLSDDDENDDDKSIDDVGISVRKKRRQDKESATNASAAVVPEIIYKLMSSYEERLLLKKLEQSAKMAVLPPHVNRLRCKLSLRQLKREHGLQQFDLDGELNKLSHRCWGLHTGNKDKQMNVPGNYYGELRILDKFQLTTYNLTKAQSEQQPSFLNRLVGYEDDQLQSICSPFTARILKPFIRRDYESRPKKLSLLEEIKAYPHRNDPTWKCETPPPIDYCYVRPQHIPSVNALCREFFWPGIDLSECLQYPDFSCVVLFRKIVIGFAFMVPDVKQNEAYISFIFTHPEWRGSHIATFMLYHLIQTCMGKDVTLHCSATNSAMLLYQAFGFKPEEFILDFYDKYYPADTRQCKHAFYLRLSR